MKLMDLARAAVSLSEAGLKARGLGEEVYLAPLTESLATGQTQADRLLGLYHGVWGESLDPIYAAVSLQ